MTQAYIGVEVGCEWIRGIYKKREDAGCEMQTFVLK